MEKPMQEEFLEWLDSNRLTADYSSIRDFTPLPDIASTTAAIIADMQKTLNEMHESAEQLKKMAREAGEKAEAIDVEGIRKQFHKDTDF